MKKEVQGFGLTCPKPLILTKKAYDEDDTSQVYVTVDNEAAKENILKFASSVQAKAEAETIDGGFAITIEKGEVTKTEEAAPAAAETGGKVIAFASDRMGSGDEELGKVLVKSFFYTVAETQPYPDALVFYNAGVHLSTTGSPVLDDLKRLEEAGVTIYSCGTCLDFYNKKEQLEVGEISNMYTIYETLSRPGKTLVFD